MLVEKDSKTLVNTLNAERDYSDLIKAWIDALRSAEYKQGFMAYRKQDRYCATGVLADIIMRRGDFDMHWVRSYRPLDMPRELYLLKDSSDREIFITVNIHHEGPLEDVDDINDSWDLDFDGIADVIEESLSNGVVLRITAREGLKGHI